MARRAKATRNSSKSAGKTTSLRIIAGEHRGRRLDVPQGKTVRPTSDRARESLFNILLNGYKQDDGRSILAGGLVLDCFAGSGAIGLEALSRGAAQIVFMENGPDVVPVLADNIAPYGASVRLEKRSALMPSLAPKPAALVFMDPPYDFEPVYQVVSALERSGWIDADTLLVIERDQKDDLELEGFELIEARKIGRNQFFFLAPSAS